MQNQIPENWQKVKFGEILAEAPQYGYTASSSQKKVGPKLLRITDIQNDFVDWKSVPYCEISEKEKSKYLLEHGDIVFARTGNTTGANFYLKSLSAESAIFASYLIRIRPDKNKCIPEYLAYFLRSRSYWGQVRNLLSGSAQPGINASNLQNFVFDLPVNVSTQEKLVAILSAFDDKIEVNNKITKTLEQMAQTIFKQWFVKSNFPAGKLSDIAEITMGQSPPSSFYNSVGDGMPFHQGVTNFGNRFPRNEIFCTFNNRLAQEGDLLFSVRAPVGRINIADTKISLGRGVASIRHRKGYQSYLYYLLKRLFKKEDSLGGGSVFPSVTKDDMEGMKIIIPDDKVVEKFESIVNDMDKKINLVERENQKLATLRDLLLPKLMKGEIIV